MQRSIRKLAVAVIACYLAIAAGLTYWQAIRAQELVYSGDNGRLAREEERIARGRILDAGGRPLVYSQDAAGGTQRIYADPTLAQVTGYYSARYGSAGLESSFARYLRGDVQANPVDTVTADLLHRRTIGSDLVTTLDGRIQAAAAQAMGADRGALVALDPRTGAVRAMVSVPYFDPGRLEQDWKRLETDPGKPLLNRVTQGLYTPGSVFKIVTASAAIDLGLVDLDKHYTCTEDLVVDGFRIANKNHPGVSDLTFVDDFAYSCNVTFAKTGLGLQTRPLPIGDDVPDPAPWAGGIDESRRRFEDYARRFGLESPLAFDLPTSTSRIGKAGLSRVELANTAFGQGDLQVTPLLMALGTATIANGGKTPQPYLVEEVRSPAGSTLLRHSPSAGREVMSPETARSMNRLMVASVDEGYAKPAQIAGIQVGGKTGSAEVGPNQKTHSWFVGYAPADNPVIAVAVIMENKGSGSDFATPAGRKVMEAAISR